MQNVYTRSYYYTNFSYCISINNTPIRYISTIRFGIASVDGNMEIDKSNSDGDGDDSILSIHHPIAFCPNRKERTFGYLFIKSTTSKAVYSI